MFGHDIAEVCNMTDAMINRATALQVAQEIAESEGITFDEAIERVELALEAGLPMPTR